MAFFSPKTWKQRIVEFPGRRRLDDTSTADVYDVSRAEGNVMQEGDGFTAVNMNDLEERIKTAIDQAESAINALNSSKQNVVIQSIAGDLNDYLSLGSGYTVSTVTNKPPGVGNGYVEILPSSDGKICLQRYTAYNSSIQYERWYLSGTWGDWIQTRG